MDNLQEFFFQSAIDDVCRSYESMLEYIEFVNDVYGSERCQNGCATLVS